MKAFKEVRVMGASLLFGAVLVGHSLVGQAASPACDRACLEGVAEKYLAGMLTHDPSKAPIAPGTRYTENAVELPLPDGLWRTVDSIGKYRLYVSDPQQGQIGFFAKGMENGAPVLIATRLKVVNGQITEIETYVPRLTDTITAGPSSVKRTDQLGDAPRKQFVTALPPDKRLSREKMSSIASSYWGGLENNHGEKVPPFADDCMRLENGTQTSGVPLAPGATRATINMKCAESFALGYYREDTRMRNRRMLVIDEERGLVYAGCFFDHDATVRKYQVKDGTTKTVTNTGPWTWGTHEIFQINAEGKIGQVEAVLLSVPYGMRPGWDTGVHMPSEQVKKDGFKEY
ncbi:MAG: hypothetical protein WDO56_19965 [Gammaproteobacteria bacterium]